MLNISEQYIDDYYQVKEALHRELHFVIATLWVMAASVSTRPSIIS